MVKVILLLCLVGLVFGAYIVDQPDAARGKDNYMDMNNPSFNNGARVYFSIGYGLSRMRTLIQFDTLSIIPVSSIIDSAKITYIKGSTSAGSMLVQTACILRDWGEGNKIKSVARTGESSWNCWALPSTWTSGGCGGIGTDRTASLDSQVVSGDDPLVMYVTSCVQNIVTTGINYGIIHHNTTGIVTTRWWGFASDYAIALKRPKLEVWYPDVPADGVEAIYYSTPLGIRRGR